MRRGATNEMQVNVAGIRRNIKNIAHNYSDAQRKVREATSNDHWGPSSTLMSEIADLTYNVVAFSEIMQMIWRRLNDHGRNWRHVYKALVLLEYLIKTGSEKVGQQCKENIFAIQTLKDFQYLEEGKDQGQNVREKAKQLANLLKDDERLKNERARALKAKERFAQSACGFGGDGSVDTPTSPRYPAFRGDWNARDQTDLPRDIEIARPQTAGEEELQLQLALAMSREEAEQEEQKRKSDDVRLQLALSQSQQDFKVSQSHPDFKVSQEKPSHMLDLLDVNLGGDMAPPVVDPWGMPQPPRPQSSPWQQQHSTSLTSPVTTQDDPWQPHTGGGSASAPPKADPWGVPPIPPNLPVSPINNNLHNTGASGGRNDPWSPTSQGSSTDLDEFDVITNRNKTSSPTKTNGSTGNLLNNGAAADPFELNLLGDVLPPSNISGSGPSPSTGATKKTPQSFLGENSSLVNLDNLVTSSKPTNTPLTANPFSDPAGPQRPVFNTPAPKPSINEIKQQSFAPFTGAGAPTNSSFVSQPQSGLGMNPPPYAYTGNTTFGVTNGTTFGTTQPPAVTQDPWAPASSGQQQQMPWMKSSEANPFLS